MKKNLRRKLITSGVALGVAALSVVSTTYAWFTMNTTATVAQFTGEAAAPSEGLYIGYEDWNDSNKVKWGKAINTATIEHLIQAKRVDAQDTKLLPAQLDGSVYENMGGTAQPKGLIKFDLFVRVANADNQTKVYLKDTLAATTSSFVLAANAGDTDQGISGAPTKAGDSVTVNILEALKLSVTIQQGNTDAGTFTAGAQSATTTHYHAGNNTTGFNATTYYQNVTGETLGTAVQPTYNSNALLDSSLAAQQVEMLSTVTNGAVYKVSFTYWLDGWDNECFDAIAAQTFTSAIEFSTEQQA
jgi:hypothetical protein